MTKLYENSVINELNSIDVLKCMQDVYFMIIDSEGTILYLNKEPEDYAFFENRVKIGASVFDSIGSERGGKLKKGIKNLLSNGAPIKSIETIKGNGIKTYYERRIRLLGCSQGGPPLILIEARDASTEKYKTNKIDRITTDFNNHIENANALIIGIDNFGYVTDWNSTCEQVTGYSKKNALARQFTSLFIDEQGRFEFDSFLESIRGGNPVNKYEVPITSKAGKEINLLINGTPRKNSAGQIDGILMVAQDITELISYRKSLEKKVDQRTRELEISYEKLSNKKDEIEQEKKKSQQLLLNILPAKIAEELNSQGRVKPRSYSSTTIVFIDIVNFSRLTKDLPPEDILQELNELFVGFDKILQDYGLEKIKTIGDGYLAVGGIPEPNETHAIDAVEAALKISSFVGFRATASEKSAIIPWQVKIGIHSGELVAGVIGDDKFAYDVWGASVNIASRMQSTCEPGKVNISGSTYDLVHNKFHCLPRGLVEVKNIGELSMFYVTKSK